MSLLLGLAVAAFGCRGRAATPEELAALEASATAGSAAAVEAEAIEPAEASTAAAPREASGVQIQPNITAANAADAGEGSAIRPLAQDMRTRQLNEIRRPNLQLQIGGPNQPLRRLQPASINSLRLAPNGARGTGLDDLRAVPQRTTGATGQQPVITRPALRQ